MNTLEVWRSSFFLFFLVFHFIFLLSVIHLFSNQQVVYIRVYKYYIAKLERTVISYNIDININIESGLLIAVDRLQYIK